MLKAHNDSRMKRFVSRAISNLLLDISYFQTRFFYHDNSSHLLPIENHSSKIKTLFPTLPPLPQQIFSSMSNLTVEPNKNGFHPLVYSFSLNGNIFTSFLNSYISSDYGLGNNYLDLEGVEEKENFISNLLDNLVYLSQNEYSISKSSFSMQSTSSNVVFSKIISMMTGRYFEGLEEMFNIWIF
jgi:hypothetical protein